MCGITGYIGQEQAAPILIEGLSKLEYRGYDSAGIAVYGNGRINIAKAKGRLAVLQDLVKADSSIVGTLGIGHTRWATHGEPSVPNSHPHYNKERTIAVVHNGIIENYRVLKDRLLSKGYVFESETDTEVVAHLLDYYYKKYGRSPLETIAKLITRVEGSFALGIIFSDKPDTLYATRKDSPLAVGIGDGCNYIASDAPAILKRTRDVIYIDNLEIAEITSDSVSVYNLDLEISEKEIKHIEWDIEAAEKNGFEHFMLKEIYEQPKALTDTISPRIKEGRVDLSELGLSEEEIKELSRIYIVACGSAYHVGVCGKYVLEKLARIPVEVDIASEFRYRSPIFEKNSVCIIISQSGETADSLAALREAKANGVRTIGVVNVLGSSIARESDSVVYTWAGPEIAVATTKAYSTQLSVMYLMAVYFARIRSVIDGSKEEYLVKQILALPEKIASILGDKESLQQYASKCYNNKDVFFIGRGLDYAAALEGSLKLKEISYIHSETYAAGELKHGTISLIEDGTLVITLATQPDLYDKMTSNTVEVKSRGAQIFSVTTASNTALAKISDTCITVPETDPLFAVSLEVIPLQLLAYYVSLAKGLDVDKPRNLAKSVTVE